MRPSLHEVAYFFRFGLGLFFSLLFVTLSLFPLGAHLLELPAKIKLTQADYRTVQQIYHGWAFTGLIVLAALVSTGLLTLRLRGERELFNPALVAFAGVTLSQIIFWTVTFPVNQKTNIRRGNLIPPSWSVSKTFHGASNDVAIAPTAK